MWKYPWGYKEGWTICAGLFLTGLLIQFTGETGTEFFRFPVNMVVLFAFVLLLVCWIGVNYLPAAKGQSVHIYN
ncbi:MAG: hypothetical protein LBT84_01970 [Spirochaetia bacterium]|jgi:hypothetical protein|nr:hypothetical protein [Spirochaetia bacterium]